MSLVSYNNRVKGPHIIHFYSKDFAHDNWLNDAAGGWEKFVLVPFTMPAACFCQAGS